MKTKPIVAIVYGGDSAEYVISVESCKNIFNAVDTGKFSPWKVELKGLDWVVILDEQPVAKIDRNDFSFIYQGEKIKFDFAYITIHGTPGENGLLQGYFDMIKIPYSTCDVGTSALTFNKYFCSNYLKNFGVEMAESILLKKAQTIEPESVVEQLGLPLFVKPNSGGSSFGVTKVKTVDELGKAIQVALKEDTEVLIEQFIDGVEFTCGLVKLGNKNLVFPLTEVRPKNEFFDFEAKYVKGKSDEITPARLSDDLTIKCQALSSNIYDLCGCQGIVRIDYILKDDVFYFLEINTTPGMTGTSFIPQQVAAMGMELSDLLTQIIEEKLN